MRAAAVGRAPRPARITYIPGRVTCPLAGVGTRAANASNRLVTDPDTEVTIANGTITLRDDRPRPTKTPIADLVWLAEGPTASGRRVPFTIHLEVTKRGRDVSVDLHTHEPRPLVRKGPRTTDRSPVRSEARIGDTLGQGSPLGGPRTTDRSPVRSEARIDDTLEGLVYEPLEVVIDDLVLDARRLAAAVERIPLARRAAAALMTTRDHLTGVVQDPAPGYRVIDRSIGIGAFGRGVMLVRSKLVSLAASNAPLITQGSLAEMLRHGAWELSIEALTDRLLPEIMARDLVLFGLDELPVLREVCAGNLRQGQVFAFRCTPDGGEVRLDDERAPLPDALDVARAYLEFNMLGGALAAAVER
ncbi:MAG: hypothetical protein M3680_13360 [Myxococcota bacterium]|nr:hypothetical protein [Myxococcota bacterium]